MAKLYVITGPAGVGKSTISRKIAEASYKSALIEGDDLYAQIVGGFENLIMVSPTHVPLRGH
jgi:predicted ABC-type ATPase